jgi:hypothetical protein
VLQTKALARKYTGINVLELQPGFDEAKHRVRKKENAQSENVVWAFTISTLLSG